VNEVCRSEGYFTVRRGGDVFGVVWCAWEKVVMDWLYKVECSIV